MIQFLLALLGVGALMILSFLAGMGILVWAMMKALKDEETEAILITYDEVNNKLKVLDSKEFTYEVFDKN